MGRLGCDHEDRDSPRRRDENSSTRPSLMLLPHTAPASTHITAFISRLSSRNTSMYISVTPGASK